MDVGTVTSLSNLSDSFNHFLLSYKDPKLLYCQNGGYFMRILPDGTVEGTRDHSDIYSVAWPGPFTPQIKLLGLFGIIKTPKVYGTDAAILSIIRSFDLFHRAQQFPESVQLRLQAVSRGVVTILGIEAGHYLAMSGKGHLHGSPSPTEECFFLETLEENGYNTYRSKEYLERNWYVAIRKNGNAKPGPKTNAGQKAILFLPMQVKNN